MKIGIVTGASSGMGKEFVKLILKEQTQLDELWVIARRKDRLEAWAKHYKNQKFRTLALDLQKEDDLKKLKGLLEEEDPRISLFIHSAGFGIMGRIDEISTEEQMEMVDVNCKSVAALTSMVLPYMATGGRMIYLASAAAFIPQPGFALYSATKSFVLSYVRSLRAEERNKKLRITAVCPGSVKTEFFNRAAQKEDVPAYKKMVMAEAKDVVKKAWRDNRYNKDVSVYGAPMQLFRFAVKIVPHQCILFFMGR